MFRSDRSNRRCGGVATYVSTRLKPLLIEAQVDSEDFECLFVQLNFHLNKKLTIGNFYRAPSAPVDSARSILSTINSLNRPSELIILGDFNWNWSSPSSTNEKKLFESINLTQLITEPTRITDTTSTLLDLIFVSHPNRIMKSGVLSDCFSDHCIIYCVWKIKLPRLPPKFINIRQSKQVNIENFIHDVISIDWDRFQLIPFVEEAWSYFHEELTKVINRHAPWKSVRVKGRHLPWISPNLINLYRQRDNAWSKHRVSKEQVDWDEYKRLRNVCKTQTRNAEAEYYRDSLCQDFKNPKQFWKRLNNILSPPKSSVEQIKVNNEVIQDPVHISNVFNQHFTSVGNNSSSYLKTHVSNPSLPGSFSFRKILPLEIFKVISDLKINCSPGPDGLEAKFIKMAADVLIYPLADLFNMSISTCTFPSSWKCAKVTPLHKGGDPLEVNNYRPISIINTVAKIFEKIIFNQLSQYVNDFNILSPSQSGFRSNFSTTTALVKFTNDIYSALGKGHLVGAIFIDLSKAFDLVDHYLLLDNLYAIGVSQPALFWFNSYLHNRRQ